MPDRTADRLIMDTGEARIACAIVVNTSANMVANAQALQDAVVELVDEIKVDAVLRNRVDLCLITYDDDPRIVQPFNPNHFFALPHFNQCKGIASTHKAIRFALDTLNERKEVYRNNCVPYILPWLWLFTDGSSDDPDNGSFDELLQLQNMRKLSFYAVGIGPNTRTSELKSMHRHGLILSPSHEEYRAAFEYISGHFGRDKPTPREQDGRSPIILSPPSIVIE